MSFCFTDKSFVFMLQFYGLCFCYFYIHDKSRLNLRRVVCVGSVGFCKRDAERACVLFGFGDYVCVREMSFYWHLWNLLASRHVFCKSVSTYLA